MKAYSSTDSSEWSEVRSFSVATSTVGIPALTFPPADTATNDSFPDFDWSDVAGATQYELQVGKGHRWFYSGATSWGIRVHNASDLGSIEYIHNASLYNMTRMLVKDTLLLVCSSGGVYITGISNPYTVHHLSTYSMAGNDVALRDTLMFVASQSQGMRVVNIANPLAPAYVTSCDSTNYTRAIELAGDRAYVLSGGYLKVVDISNPAAPSILGSLALTNALDLAVAGNYVYTASQSTGLQVVDVSNPAAPVLQGSCYTAGNFRRIKVSGDMAYVAAVSGGLRIINLANPSNPVEFGHYATGSLSPEDIALTGKYAYLTGDGDNGWLLDVTDPYNPVLAAQPNNTSNCEVVAVNDSFAGIELDSVLAATACQADTFLGDGRHYWRARAGAGAWGEYSQPRKFIMDTQKPSETWNNSPYHGQLMNVANTILDWNNIGDADRYQVQLGRDSSFASPELDTLVPAGICTLLTPLGDGRIWWHVRAIDLAGNQAVWSDSTYYRLDTQAPGAPTGITANGGNPSPWTKTNNFSISFTPAFDSTGAARYYYKKGSEPASNYDTTDYGWDYAPPIDNIKALGSGYTPFYVWAKDTAGNLDYRNYAQVGLRYDSIPPEGAKARSNEFSRATSFTVSWDTGTDQGGSGLNGRYWIKSKVNGGGWTDLNTNYPGTSYVHSGVQGSKYYFEVSALDSAGNSEAFTGAAECSTLVDNTINFPVLVSPYNGSYSDTNQVSFLWQKVPGYAGSRLQCASDTAFASLVRDTVLAADSAVTLTLSDNLYYWRARGQNSASDTSLWAPRRSFRVDTQDPSVPSLLSPAADTVLNDNTPQFSWNASAGAKSYNLLVSPDTLFSSLSKDITTDSTWYSTDVTLPDSAYYWKVRAGDAAGNWSAYSSRRKLTIDTKAPPVPVLASPADNATVTTNLPAFTWRTSAQAVQYRMQAAANTSFSPLEMDSTLADTAVRPLWGLNDGLHYWRVRSRDGAGNWSAYSDYRTVNIAGLLQVALITPDTGSLWAPSQSVWIQFSKPINTGNIDTVRVKIRGKHTSIVRQSMVWERTSRTLRITPDTCFAANDTVTVFVHGSLLDSTGSTTLDGNNNGAATGDSLDSYQMSFRTSYIGDYNPDGALNAADLLLFTWGWNNYSRYYEAGPYIGAWPHQRVNPGTSTKLDFEDLMGFIYSWNQSGGAKPGKSGGGESVWLECDSLGTEVKVMSENGSLFRALDAELDYDSGCLALESVNAGGLWGSADKPRLFLEKRQPGRITVSAALWPETASQGGELFTLKFSRIKSSLSDLSLWYRTYDSRGVEVCSGSRILNLAGARALPVAFRMEQASPNPASRSAAIRYQLPASARVKLEVFNITGQRVATLVDGEQTTGYYAVSWDMRLDNGKKASNGIYFFKLQAGNQQAVGKLTIIR